MNLGHSALSKINYEVKLKSHKMTHLSALHIHVSGTATWLRFQHACRREEPGVSVLLQQAHC